MDSEDKEDEKDFLPWVIIALSILLLIGLFCILLLPDKLAEALMGPFVIFLAGFFMAPMGWHSISHAEETALGVMQIWDPPEYYSTEFRKKRIREWQRLHEGIGFVVLCLGILMTIYGIVVSLVKTAIYVIQAIFT